MRKLTLPYRMYKERAHALETVDVSGKKTHLHFKRYQQSLIKFHTYRRGYIFSMSIWCISLITTILCAATEGSWNLKKKLVNDYRSLLFVVTGGNFGYQYLLVLPWWKTNQKQRVSVEFIAHAFMIVRNCGYNFFNYWVDFVLENTTITLNIMKSLYVFTNLNEIDVSSTGIKVSLSNKLVFLAYSE